MDEVIIVVERGFVSEVYSTAENVIVSVLDMDTTDGDRMGDLVEERKELKNRVETGELYSVL